MTFQKRDIGIFSNSAWTNLCTYSVVSGTRDPLAVSLIIDILTPEKSFVLTPEQIREFRISPYCMGARRRFPQEAAEARWIADLASSYIRKSEFLEVSYLIDLLSNQKIQGKSLEKSFIEHCLKCCVTDDSFTAYKKNKKDPNVYLRLSSRQRQVEKRRLFAGTLASDLEKLSDRIRNLIEHRPTAGAYRENLLQTLLQRLLPERYHVATGFIYGSDKQIDVLIYDKIDYAPVFREGNLVVVPPESVRAVIEVKTSLSKEELCNSLQDIHRLSFLDDLKPPFFKGIFAFGSPLSNEKILDVIVDFYTPSENIDEMMKKDMIFEPFRHLTAICVNNKVYGNVQYRLNENERLIPWLFSSQSATELSSQVTYFFSNLLAYLQVEALKPHNTQLMVEMLGADSYLVEFAPLTENSWGSYFSYDEGLFESAMEDVKKMETLILSTHKWLAGS